MFVRKLKIKKGGSRLCSYLCRQCDLIKNKKNNYMFGWDFTVVFNYLRANLNKPLPFY